MHYNLPRRILKVYLLLLVAAVFFIIPKEVSAQACTYNYNKVDACKIEGGECVTAHIAKQPNWPCTDGPCSVNFKTQSCIFVNDPVASDCVDTTADSPTAAGDWCCLYRETNDTTYSCASGGGGGGGGGAQCTACKKNCPESNQLGTCGVGSDGAQKYICKVSCEEETLEGCNGSSISCTVDLGGGCRSWMAGQPNASTTQCTRDRDTNERRYEACCGCTVVAPGKPDPYYPENGQGVDYSSVWLYWDPASDWGVGCPTNNNRYSVYVGTTNPPTNRVANLGSGTRSYQYTDGQNGVSTYYWRIGATNGSRETYSNTWSFSQGVISGRVFEDPDRQASLVGGVCTLGGANPIQPGDGSTVSIDGTYSGAVGVNGTYSVYVPAGPGHVATLVVDPANWTCTCPEDCAYGTDSPVSNLNYYVTNIRNAWFQVMGGSLHANGGNVSSEIPSTCTGVCDPYLILSDAGGQGGLVSYTGSLNLGDQTSENIAESSADWQAQSAYGGTQTGYDYFSRILNDDPNGLGIWSGAKPLASGVYNAQGVTRTDGTDWNIGSGEQIVLLTDGDLVIDNNINVAQGGFLAIIASGSIIIADAVTNVEGVYIADGDIATCESATCGSGGLSEQLTAQGIFVGWTGIELRRDFTTSDNNTNPAETFVYRPDLQVNAYQYLLNPKYTWQEVAP